MHLQMHNTQICIFNKKNSIPLQLERFVKFDIF